MCIKATILAYAFSLQCFENATVVAYVGLRVKIENIFYHCDIDMVKLKYKNHYNVSSAHISENVILTFTGVRAILT